MESCRQAGASDATINRELTIVRRGFTLGFRAQIVARQPYIAMLEEDNVRQGFLEPELYDKLLEELPVRRRQTKGKKPRTLPIYGDVEAWLLSQYENRAPNCQWVFTIMAVRLGLTSPDGTKPVKRPARPGLLFHDLRRSAVRNMKRAGNPDKAVMEISGHKTRSVFDRYDMVPDADITTVAQRTEEYLKARKEAPQEAAEGQMSRAISPIALEFGTAPIVRNPMMLRWLCSFLLEWRNWQTHGTQNPAPFTGHVGSTPTSSTK